MCKYCEQDEDRTYLNMLGKPVSMSLGKLGKATADLELHVPDDNDGNYELVYAVGLVSYGFDEFKTKSVRIKYCPFCGRKLKESE